MKKIIFVAGIVFSLIAHAQDTISDDSTSKKVFVSFFAGNTGMTDYIWETYYDGWPPRANYYIGKTKEIKTSIGIGLGFKLKKDFFFNMAWSANILNSNYSNDISKNSDFIQGSPYSVNEYEVKQSAYIIQPGFSKNIFESEKFSIEAGFNIPFIFYGKFSLRKTNYGYDSASVLVSSSEELYTCESSRAIGFEFFTGIKYFPCSSFYLNGNIGIAMNYTWSDSNLIYSSRDLISGTSFTPVIIYKSFTHFGFSDVCANLGFGFRF